MKRQLLVSLSLVVAAFYIVQAFSQSPSQTQVLASDPEAASVDASDDSYDGKGGLVVIAWNNLGMHCISPRFKEMCILPPYNTLEAQVIDRGNPPKIITQGITLRYRIENNTTVKGKTDFWTHAKDLFGADLKEGVGLTGKGLTGTFDLAGDRFRAEGIPVLPLDDKMRWNPYQVAVVTVHNAHGHQIASARVVLPISDELNCQKCHADNGDANPDIATGTIEGNILTVHDNRNGTTLMDSRPVLCADCHSDAALNMTSTGATKSLSQAMHGWHAGLQDMPACYDCHPGEATHCLRTAVTDMGTAAAEPDCAFCHGDLPAMADSLAQGRQPWAQEPTCNSCHGDSHPQPTDLYRNATGHGGLGCPACHNSPHAWWPSKLAVDNLQPNHFQDSPGPIGRCRTCHTKTKLGTNPHVTLNFTSQMVAAPAVKPAAPK